MKKEYLYAGISILLWASAAALVKLLLNGMDSMQVTMFSTGFGFLFMLVLNLIKKNFKVCRSYRLIDYVQMSIMGLLGIFLYYLFFYMAVEVLLAQEAFIINYLWPVMTVLFATIILKERMTSRKGIALVLSFAGVMIVITKGSLANLRMADIKGVLLAFSAAVVFGLYAVLNKKKSYDKYFSIMIFFFVSFIFSLIYLMIKKDIPRIDAFEFAGLLWNGVFVYAIAQTTWFLALDKGNTAKISNLAFFTPFISLIYIYVFLHEKIGLYSVIGLVVIVIGIFIQMGDRETLPVKAAADDKTTGPGKTGT
jgi:drug/metabolite transporter (DMT)-like permease